MRSLFVKFFLSFLLIIILFATIAISLTYLRDQQFPPLAHQDFARQAIKEYGRGAIEAYEQQGRDQLKLYTDKLFRRTGVNLLLFDQRGRALTDRPMPRRMQGLARRALETGEVVFPMMGPRNRVAALLQNEQGQSYVVVVGLPDKPKPAQLLQGPGRGYLGWQLLVLLAVAALVCFWLARSFAAPISRLRRATRQFAAGELSIRVGKQVRGQHEIAALARDFDHMAERIEDLIAAQQRLLRDISHELRSPLGRLVVALELARRDDPEARQKALQRIELEAERMNEMIGQLLSLTRLESGASELQRSRFDLNELLFELVQDADFEARNRGCRVEFDGRDARPLFGSRDLLARAFENVIRNAVKYTTDNSTVTVQLAGSHQDHLIRILDQGPGVPEEALEKLFEPFFRVADARDRESGGTGIGLAIAERAIELHGGRIKAINHSAGGLLVEIILPSTSD